jgi:hypothetical protein
MPARDLAMENDRQNDQTDQEKKSQPLGRSNSSHLEQIYNTIREEKSTLRLSPV